MVTITFKSDNRYYLKEKSDKKNNTYRELKISDPRYKAIQQYYRSFMKNLNIEIINTLTQNKFSRKIRDVSFLDMKDQDTARLIITWEPKISWEKYSK